MRWHAIAVWLDERWKCSADLVNEYLRLFRYSEDWTAMREDLGELLECGGFQLDLLIGPDPGKRVSVAGPPGYPTVLEILYVSKVTIPSQAVQGCPEWQTSGSVSPD